ncbi:MAG TPA: hypothetical protein VFQ44_12665 [Streptosporangiaceae bacterium]|nr:hypothetical protein [Streptosporangiaceae bacterium]
MQREEGPNAGFSSAPASSLYLPVDPDPGPPAVASQRALDGSLLHQVRRLVALRKSVPALRAGGPVHVLNEGYPLVYARGGTHLVVINPRRERATFAVVAAGTRRLASVLSQGVTVDDGVANASGFGYGIFEL